VRRWAADFLSRLRRLVRTRRADEAPHIRAGREGERLAARHLRTLGWRVLGRNLRLPMGEIDILAEEPAPGGPTIVLVEVKARVDQPGVARPPPEAAITLKKQRTLRAMLAYLRRVNGWTARAARIDVVAVDLPCPGVPGPPALRHYRDAVGRP
jgi:putative endonuclease